MDVLESEYLFDARLSQAVMVGALSAHPKADFEAGGKAASKTYQNALSALPYYKAAIDNGAVGSEQSVREDAANRWHAAKDALAADLANGDFND